MKAIDFRNATFESIRKDLEGLRLQVYEAWMKHGPCTTRQLAQHCGIDLLTVRPRTTELVQLGLLEPCEARPENIDPHEGVYRPTLREQWNQFREHFVSKQLQLI